MLNLDSDEKVNILLVDDRPDKLLALETVLEPFGQNIIKAGSGPDALRLLLKHEFAVILLDVNMPGMDGFEVASLIRKRKTSENTPIIFITGINVTETHVSRGYSLGAVDYIFSPVVPEMLQAKVAVFIDLYRKRQQVKRQGEQLLAEAMNKASGLEQRLDDLLNRLNVGIFTASDDGRLLTANPAFFRIVGVSEIDSSKRIDIPALFSRPQTKPGETEDPLKGTADDICIRRSDGSEVWVLLTKTFRKDARGELLIEGLLEDITVRRKAEQSAREEASRKDKFLAVLSHELRNPLAAIQSAVHISTQVESEEERTWARNILERQVKHLTRLIDDLLDLSRISQDKIRLKKQPLDLGDIVKKAVEVTKPLIEERKHEVSIETDGAAHVVSGDPTRLEQIVVNIVQNAAKYSNDHGRIRISVERKGDSVVLAVADTGVGIRESLLSKIFEPFAQLDGSLDRAAGGLGIGLNLARRLTELHGGQIEARSEGFNRGSEFRIILPALSEAPVNSDEQKTTPPKRQENGKVLLVDDNVDSAMLTAQLLRTVGYEVFVAHDGPDGIYLAERYSPDIALLDIGLPGMNGFELARELRKRQKNSITLVAISGYGQEQDLANAREAQFDHHFLKPVDFNVLAQYLSEDQRGRAAAQHGDGHHSETSRRI